MWEFSLNISSENFDLAKGLFLSLKKFSSSIGGVVTSHEEKGNISILIGVPEELKGQYQNYITGLVCKCVCSHFKLDYLSKNLILPIHENIGIVAFKTALLSFDRETDFYIIRHSLDFSKNLYLESFYLFKLSSLRKKWAELVSIANENHDYIISSDSFIDLIKFLIDNLEINSGEVDIVEEKDGYRLILDSEDDKTRGNLTEEGLISSIIDLSPQKINLYRLQASQATNLLEKIFAQRINVKNIGKKPLQKFEK